ncbi:hypothetical protein ABZ635_14960 [Nocardiopsis sp. NPDC007018]|uniref:hypothetical protein n=1 Tax=Nocardiopsis sp. NPDC007018 TaxID=3155721 RepID=UPI0033E8F604
MSVSPLTLLHEWTARTDEAPLREFLLVGRVVDLSALERELVPAAQDLGAAVTVLGTADEEALVRRPDRVYALVDRPVPDLALLLGDEHVVAAFGSGPPSGGERVWTVLRGGPDGVPWALAELGAWMSACASDLDLPAALAERLAALADRLEDLLLTRPLETPVRVVHNLEAPLVDQLPEGPVDELTLHAPLRGYDAPALAALTGRLSPSRVRLGVPGSWADQDREDAVRSLAEAGVVADAYLVAEGFPAHGGLVEWCAGDRRSALTCGSGLAALTRTAVSGAALELGLVVPADPSPEPTPRVGATADDPRLSEVTAELEEAGWSLESDAGLHRVRGAFTNPVPVAARVAELLEEDTGPVLVHAEGPKGWALIVWRRPTLLLASAPRGSAWRLYRVDPPATPSSRLGGGEGVSRVGLLRTSAPLHRVPHRDVLAFLESLGTDHITLLERVGHLTTPL